MFSLLTQTQVQIKVRPISLVLNGFELAPAGVETGVGTAFTPSAYLGIASITAGMKTLPTGLPPHLWYSQGKSGASASGRFGDNGTSQFLSANIGLHPIDESVDTEGGHYNSRSECSTGKCAKNCNLCYKFLV